MSAAIEFDQFVALDFAMKHHAAVHKSWNGRRPDEEELAEVCTISFRLCVLRNPNGSCGGCFLPNARSGSHPGNWRSHACGRDSCCPSRTPQQVKPDGDGMGGMPLDLAK